ncbi:cadherin-like domain-containing protein [Candidatus Woesearchaeota archaeon]|nr:cadherin-like domain-containing protein [Candidatus Woesearchaeota archaeon]
MKKNYTFLIALVLILLIALTAASALAAGEDLEITDVKVGLKGDLASVADKSDTTTFHPGEEVFIELTLKNNGKNTIEKIDASKVIVAHKDLGIFPTKIVTPVTSIDAGKTDKIVYSYTLLTDLKVQTSEVKFSISGTDKVTSKVTALSERTINFKVGEAVLQISNVKVNGKTYVNDGTTDAVKPGETVSFEVTVKNTKSSGAVVDLSLTATPKDKLKLTNFPNKDSTELAAKNSFINSGDSKTYTFDYVVPVSLAEANYEVTFAAGAKDNNVVIDGDKLTVKAKDHVIKLNVNQIVNDFKITNKEDLKKLETDSKLTFECSEKGQQKSITVVVANTGKTNKNDVFVKLMDGSGKEVTKDLLENIESGKTKDAILTFPIKDLIGTHAFKVQLIGKAGESFNDEVSINVIVKNCDVTLDNSQPFTITEDKGAQAFDLTKVYTNIEANEAVTVTVSSGTKVSANVDNSKKTLTLTPQTNFNGQDTITLTVSDASGSKVTKAFKVIVNNDNVDLPKVSKQEPSNSAIPVTKTGTVVLTVSLSNPDLKTVDYEFVDKAGIGFAGSKGSSNKETFGVTYTFDAKGKTGDHPVKLQFNEASGLNTISWTITIVDKPVDFAKFAGSKTTNPVTIADSDKVPNFVLENSNGMIAFSQDVKLSDVASLADVVIINNGYVSVDSAKASTFNQKSTITLAKSFADPIILKAAGFNANTGFTVCGDCKVVDDSKVSGKFGFEVSGFSTYKVEEKKSASLTVDEVVVENVNRETTVTKTFTVKNIGSVDAINDLKFDASSIASKYKFEIVSAPVSISAVGQETVSIKFFVPKDATGEKYSIGNIVVTGKDAKGVAISKIIPVYIQPKSFLIIEKVEVNGKESGDLRLDEENEIEVNIKNALDEDMVDVTVTVEILDVDGDDLSEESDSFDLDKTDDDTVTLKFDLSNEVVDQESYTIRITVEGETDKDGTKHVTTLTKTVNVDREKHKVIIDAASLSLSNVQCSDFTSLYVSVKNIGKNDEDDVEIRVSNSELGLSSQRTGIDLDDFSGNDNDYSATFNLDVSSAKKGSYPINVEVYRDGKLEESKTVTLTVAECGSTTQSTTGSQQVLGSDASLAQQLQAQLQAQLAAGQNALTGATVQGNFRESSSYTALLGVLIVLVFIALVLAMAVMVLKKR